MPGDDQRKRKQGGRGGGRGQGQQSRGGTGHAVPLGTTGILVTCDAGREFKAGNEAVALIEEHYDKLAAAAPGGAAQPAAAAAAAASADKDPKAGAASGDAGGGSGTKDIAALLAAEVEELKDKAAARFRVHQTGVKGVVYVLFPEDAKPGGWVNLKSPALTVLVQLIRNGCAMAVVPHYRELAKFNLRKLAEVPEGGEAAGGEAAEGEATEAGGGKEAGDAAGAAS
ncbi:hypothetical protein GPECTOR_536g540 [Gonium pectorale]|uniref:THUMP domain-containing protein n=1 Tax=Gonium pectorale TaxID=33097 RepID=A0A150FUR5_GONPE|nr:hypothetical protein GPECTOR_536g540 [Gonium pectorale]|eukprot:KXZ41337.1 hypothetical protein GPECTOR_536g540 [Gonium pectorale]